MEVIHFEEANFRFLLIPFHSIFYNHIYVLVRFNLKYGGLGEAGQKVRMSVFCFSDAWKQVEFIVHLPQEEVHLIYNRMIQIVP